MRLRAYAVWMLLCVIVVGCRSESSSPPSDSPSRAVALTDPGAQQKPSSSPPMGTSTSPQPETLRSSTNSPSTVTPSTSPESLSTRSTSETTTTERAATPAPSSTSQASSGGLISSRSFRSKKALFEKSSSASAQVSEATRQPVIMMPPPMSSPGFKVVPGSRIWSTVVVDLPGDELYHVQLRQGAVRRGGLARGEAREKVWTQPTWNAEVIVSRPDMTPLWTYETIDSGSTWAKR